MYKIIEYDEIDSTNDEAKRLIRKAVEEQGGLSLPDLYGTVIVAHRQSSGHGRRRRSFVSPGKGSVYASFILQSEVLKEATQAPFALLITSLTAVAICEAIEQTTSCSPTIKWVNDVFVDGKKVAGIFAESIPRAVILGIGVNINLDENDLPEDLREKAGSLKMDTDERGRFVGVLIESIFRCVNAKDTADATTLMDEYRRRSILLGRRIVIERENETRPAVASEIADDGALIVEYQDGTVEELRSGEISIRLSSQEPFSG